MKRDFLVEIGCEELPPKALKSLSDAFAKGVVDGLKQANLSHDAVEVFATPRRLALKVDGLDARQPDHEEQQLGPALQAAFDADGNPTPAAQGFARKLGVDVAALDQIETPKGIRLGRVELRAGQSAAALLPTIVQASLDALPIPKRMRWGSRRAEFVRPVHWVVMLLDGDVVTGDVMGLTIGNTSRGHRIHAPGEFTIEHPRRYAAQLAEKFVVASFVARRQQIAAGVQEIAVANRAKAVIDDALLDEVTALNEWPVPLLGNFEERFLKVPAEALISSMKEHQKYFHCVDDDGALLPHFITVSNLASKDPAQVVAGNEKVIRPRLSDAAFFYQTDLKSTQAERRTRLKPIVFQAELGSVWDKTERVAALAGHIAEQIGTNVAQATRAGELCKSDLVSEMVLEFGDLQGVMGQYYATADGEEKPVALAMSEQYLPRFAGDDVATNPVSICVALADRLDTLSGIFGIGQIPTGSKDPFALRRASIGVLRTMIENRLSLSLAVLLDKAVSGHSAISNKAETVKQVLTYILERLAAHYGDQGISAQVYQAVAAKQLDNPFDIDQRVVAVAEFEKLPQAASLSAANKRVSNLLSKGDQAVAAQVDPSLFEAEAEHSLFSELQQARSGVESHVANGEYGLALNLLAQLQSPVDSFFDQVMVMCDDAAVRSNRLALLSALRALFLLVADISLLAPSK